MRRREFLTLSGVGAMLSGISTKVIVNNKVPQQLTKGIGGRTKTEEHVLRVFEHALRNMDLAMSKCQFLSIPCVTGVMRTLQKENFVERNKGFTLLMDSPFGNITYDRRTSG